MRSDSLQAHRSQLSTLDTPGGRIAYLDLGPRETRPVVLVHGMPTSSYLYRHVAAQLANAGLRVIAPDLLGFGASDKPKDHAAYATRAQADRILLLLDHLGVERATFVVHDLGGPWAFEIADREPERIESLVVLNTSAYAELMTPPREARLLGGPLGPVLARVMGSRAGRPMIADFFRGFTHAGAELPAEVTDAYWTSLHEGGWRAFRAFAKNLDAAMAEFARYAAALRRLDVPAAIVWGGEDPVLDASRMVPRFATDLGVAETDVHVIDRASHFVQEDRPGEIAAAIDAFLGAHPPQARSIRS